MIRVLSFVIAVFSAGVLQAETASNTLPKAILAPAEEAELASFLWKNRLIVVFADSNADPRFVEQVELLAERSSDLAERDVIIVLDANPAAKTALREKFRPRGFMLMLIGKDGQVYLRKPLPWNVREISRSIDKLPQRQQEVRDRRERAPKRCHAGKMQSFLEDTRSAMHCPLAYIPSETQARATRGDTRAKCVDPCNPLLARSQPK